MKRLKLIYAFAISTLLMVGLTGCGGNEPTLQEKTEALLVSAEWSTPIVTVEGVDQSDLYKNFAIKFNKETYACSGGSPLWASTGNWVFKDDTASTLILDGGREVEIKEITETALELAIQNDNTTFISGRSGSIKGKNVFRLKKK